MKQVFLSACATCVLALLAQPGQAQQWSAEQMEVWDTISEMWELEMAGDDAWKDMIHPSFLGWPYESLMPRDKENLLRLIDAESGQFKVLTQNMHPLAIVVTGSTAVAHFLHMTLVEYQDGEHELFEGRSTDVLTLTEAGWQIVSWVGEEIGDSGDGGT